MGRASIPPDSDDGNAATNNTVTGLLSFHSIRDRLRFKRNPNHCQSKSQVKTAFHHYVPRNRQSNGTAAVNNRSNRKGLFSLFPFRGTYLLYFMMFLAVFGFAMASMVLQSSIASVFGSEVRRPVREAVKFGTHLRFVPRPGLHGVGLDRLRAQRRNGVRPPRIGLVSVL